MGSMHGYNNYYIVGNIELNYIVSQEEKQILASPIM